jgi:hypothetical protein
MRDGLPKRFFRIRDRVITNEGYIGRVTKKLTCGVLLDDKKFVHTFDIVSIR